MFDAEPGPGPGFREDMFMSVRSSQQWNDVCVWSHDGGMTNLLQVCDSLIFTSSFLVFLFEVSQ